MVEGGGRVLAVGNARAVLQQPVAHAARVRPEDRVELQFKGGAEDGVERVLLLAGDRRDHRVARLQQGDESFLVGHES